MIKNSSTIKKLKIGLATLLAILGVLILSTTTLAYFNFKKVYEGEGNLPILNIEYQILGGTKDSLKNIVYNGQESNKITVILNTEGNNVSGCVRAKVVAVWSNSLNNTPYNDDNVIVTACKVSNSNPTSKDLWEFKNGYYYLKEPLQKESYVVLFDSIDFGEKISAYRGEKVSIYVFTEIYQTTNLPQNW